jgi:DNA polymerase-3 subunit delta'
MAGTGKAAFALHTAQALLCQQSAMSGDPCETCHACRLVKTLAHPNVYHVTPEKEGHAIKVDQIRELAEFVQQSSFQGEYRIVIIRPAHSMNMSAANALLKTLEEPASGAILILVTELAGQLPATIRSRCQRILFPRPDQQAALQWLKSQPLTDAMQPEQCLRLAHGAPLLALSLMQDDALPLRADMFTALPQLAERRADPLALAAKWQKADPVSWLDLLLSWAADLVRLQSGCNVGQLLNQDYASALKNSAAHIPLKKNLQLMQQVLTMRGQMSAGINFNKQLLMESLLIRWSEQAI